MSRVLVAAGDTSGDLHAAELVEVLRARRPDLRFTGLGGAALEKAGVDLCADRDALAVGGLLELAGSLPRIAAAWRALSRALESTDPDLVVLVDSGGFNLPFARHVRRRSRARILYYVAPQVWAWRRGRLRRLARRVDRVAVIFPFEREFYERAGVPARFVGHPLVEPLAPLAARPRHEVARDLGLDAGARWVALLPGSRRNEVLRHLPLQLETARALHGGDPRLAFALAVAPSIDAEGVREVVRRARLPAMLELRVLQGRTREVLRASRVALLKPGTATLEAALLDVPMVVMARVHPLTAAVVRRAVRLPFFAMPNLVAGEALVPELLQEAARPAALAARLERLLDAGPERERQLRGLARVRELLGPPGAAGRAADVAEELLDAA